MNCFKVSGCCVVGLIVCSLVVVGLLTGMFGGGWRNLSPVQCQLFKCCLTEFSKSRRSLNFQIPNFNDITSFGKDAIGKVGNQLNEVLANTPELPFRNHAALKDGCISLAFAERNTTAIQLLVALSCCLAFMAAGFAMCSKISAIIQIAGGLSGLIGLIVYSALFLYNTPWSIGWAFWLTVTSVLILLANGIVTVLVAFCCSDRVQFVTYESDRTIPLVQVAKA